MRARSGLGWVQVGGAGRRGGRRFLRHRRDHWCGCPFDHCGIMFDEAVHGAGDLVEACREAAFNRVGEIGERAILAVVGIDGGKALGDFPLTIADIGDAGGQFFECVIEGACNRPEPCCKAAIDGGGHLIDDDAGIKRLCCRPDKFFEFGLTFGGEAFTLRLTGCGFCQVLCDLLDAAALCASLP